MALSGMMEKQQPVVDDVTEPTNGFTDGSKASPEEAVSPDGTDGETVSDQHGDGDDAGTRLHDDQQHDEDRT